MSSYIQSSNYSRSLRYRGNDRLEQSAITHIFAGTCFATATISVSIPWLYWLMVPFWTTMMAMMVFKIVHKFIYIGTSLLMSPTGLGKSDLNGDVTLLHRVICTVEYNLGLSHGDCNGEVF